ncbi:Ppp1r7 [Ecytonucleospora hepatopenaei]|uniref:Ppp1r7 n=1 Tax=Ecytonucleospora hepatopenaei TaxID=646526 RepID=A0A1W0E6L9_9MICR|nr:Ppp1r7 [Ecytonucleospora hepatopenaei]
MDNFSEDECFYFNNQRGKELVIDSNCKAFELRRNKLEKIPESLPSTLKYLDISDNLLKNIETERFTEIEVLDMGYNLLQDHDSIKNDTLSELYIMSNDIKEISKSLQYNKSLIKFDIAANRIFEISNLKFISEKIEEIYLGANKINNFNVDLTHLRNLKILDLQYNNLEEFDCSLLPKSVEILLLNNNKRLCKLKNQRAFKMLDLGDTKAKSAE